MYNVLRYMKCCALFEVNLVDITVKIPQVVRQCSYSKSFKSVLNTNIKGTYLRNSEVIKNSYTLLDNMRQADDL